MDDLFAAVFDELVDRDEERLALLEAIAPLLPGVQLAIVKEDGQTVGNVPETTAETLESLLAAARQTAQLKTWI